MEFILNAYKGVRRTHLFENSFLFNRDKGCKTQAMHSSVNRSYLCSLTQLYIFNVPITVARVTHTYIVQEYLKGNSVQ